jgi:hypothetical protein
MVGVRGSDLMTRRCSCCNRTLGLGTFLLRATIWCYDTNLVDRNKPVLLCRQCYCEGLRQHDKYMDRLAARALTLGRIGTGRRRRRMRRNN